MKTPAHINIPEQEQDTLAFRLGVKKRSDKLINYFLAAYFVVGLIFASFYDTWLIAIGVGGLSLVAYYSVRALLPQSELYQYVLGIVLGIFMAQYIYQMHGLFEMHFWAFIGSAILITYQNWKLQIPMLGVVVVHHVGFGYLQNSGVENVYFTQLDYFELRTFIIHFVLAAIIFFICGLWGYQLKKQNEVQIRQSLEMGRLQKEALLAKELTDLQESLAHEKYLLDSLMDNMPDMIYFKNKESRLIRVSKFMAQRFGCKVEDMIGKTDFDFQNETHARQAFEDEQQIIKTQEPKIDYIEKEVVEDGSEHWVSTTKLPMLNPRGEVIGTFGMSKDITNIKRLEREQLNADMEKAVAQGKFEIASEVMHDIGNAVVGFGAYITRIRRSLDGNHPEKLEDLAGFFEQQQPALCAAIGEAKAGAVVSMLTGITETQKTNEEEIKKSINEQLNIITHIQEILSIQRQYIDGQSRPERKTVNIRHVINDSLSMVLAIIEKNSIAVTLNAGADLPGIKGDRTRLMQLILNVLKNSIEAFDSESSDKTILVNAFRYKEQLVVQIKDNGNGFGETVAGRLFERGFTTKPSGSGLGLYNCQAIIQSHEGDINLTSEGEGKGALATIGFKI